MKGLYIHLPFCLTKCSYCNFYSQTDLSLVSCFLAGLRQEIALYAETTGPFDSLYLGGGTPSVLGGAALERLIADLRGAFTITADAEITCETNPGDITIDLLTSLLRGGVNRLTIGCQSFDDDSLLFLRRRHRASEAIAAVEAARQSGFANLAIDLIYGLPDFSGDSFAVWLTTLETALSLRSEHLSCYQLTLEPDTPLLKRLRTDGLTMPDDEALARYFYLTSEILEAAGYRHYEVSNFAREERFYSRHNGKYWNHTPYLGLGPAAHSFDGRERRWNHRDLRRYLRALTDGERPIEASETLTGEQLQLEALFLGLRTRRGISLEIYRERYGTELEKEKKDVLPQLIREGFLEKQDGHLRPTRRGMAVADSLALI